MLRDLYRDDLGLCDWHGGLSLFDGPYSYDHITFAVLCSNSRHYTADTATILLPTPLQQTPLQQTLLPQTLKRVMVSVKVCPLTGTRSCQLSRCMISIKFHRITVLAQRHNVSQMSAVAFHPSEGKHLLPVTIHSRGQLFDPAAFNFNLALVSEHHPLGCHGVGRTVACTADSKEVTAAVANRASSSPVCSS